MKSLSQRSRLLILIIYIGALFLSSRIATGSWMPPTSHKGLWFYSGLAALLLGNLLVTPFYTKPVDAIAYTVSAVIGLLAVNPWSLDEYTSFDRIFWLSVIIYIASILLASIIAIVLKDSTKPARQKIGKSLLMYTDTLGTPRAVFSIVFLFALITFHRQTKQEFITIGLAWAFLVACKPLEVFAGLFQRWSILWRRKDHPLPLGTIVGHQVPDIVLIQQNSDTHAQFGDAIIVRSENGEPGVALALDHIGFVDGRWLRALHLDLANNKLNEYLKTVEGTDVAMNASVISEKMQLDNNPIWSHRKNLIGIVSKDSNLSILEVDIVRTDIDLEEGALLEVEIGSKPTVFQLINGLTQEDILQQKNKRGYVRAEAKKIGNWNSEKKRFEVVKWVPRPNAPVFLIESETESPDKEAIGRFPRTNYSVSVDIPSLVTHNSAILGILGSGKSYLAIELVERMIDQKVKVICFDLTNQYADMLSSYYDAEKEKEFIEKVGTIGKNGKTNWQRNVEEGGSIQEFESKVKEHLKEFLKPENEKLLLIYNPSAFEVWRQDSKLFDYKAAMASLTPTEITRVFTEAAFEAVQEMGMTEEARCCLVFEEAHSLVPEWTAVAAEGDKTATNGTAKTILQGRKYGLGCLVVTQRTANVTKSILNQCNTVFALRVFDATGMEFLKNYIGEDYAAVLSTIEDRHAVVFGKASSCRDPVLIRLNDRDKFLREFREPPE